MVKSKADFIAEIEDKFNSLVRKRNELVIELDKTTNELTSLIDKKFSLDPSKVRIRCINCKGSGYSIGEDGKKKMCPVCGGMKYNWAECYIQEPEVKE